jgi:hypothetical protein
MSNLPVLDVGHFAQDLKFAREEKTLQDLTDSQWHRVCNRIANALHHQSVIVGDEWGDFMETCGCPKDREVV